jgi:hypothetical protein
VIPTLTHYSAIVSDVSSGSMYGIYIIIYYVILCVYIYTYYCAILSDVLSSIYSDILSDILSGIFSDLLSGILSGIYSDILSGIFSGILFRLFRHSFRHFISHLFWHSIWHSLWHVFGSRRDLWHDSAQQLWTLNVFERKTCGRSSQRSCCNIVTVQLCFPGCMSLTEVDARHAFWDKCMFNMHVRNAYWV